MDSSLTVIMEYWARVTPGILHLLQHTKEVRFYTLYSIRFTTSRTFVAGIRLNVRVLINKRLRPRMPSLLTSHATNAREVVKYFSVWRSSGHGVTWRVNQQVEMTIFFIWHSCIAFHFISKRASEHSPMSYIGCRI